VKCPPCFILRDFVTYCVARMRICQGLGSKVCHPRYDSIDWPPWASSDAGDLPCLATPFGGSSGRDRPMGAPRQSARSIAFHRPSPRDYPTWTRAGRRKGGPITIRMPQRVLDQEKRTMHAGHLERVSMARLACHPDREVRSAMNLPVSEGPTHKSQIASNRRNAECLLPHKQNGRE
jgi:hypothetical protein